MENENEQAQLDVVEQEEQTSADEQDTGSDESHDEETVTIAKSKFNSIRRKAVAYDEAKNKPQIKSTSSDARWREQMELKVDGYTSPEELAFIMRNGGKKALQDPFVVSALETMKAKAQAEAATLGEQGQKSNIDKRFTPQALDKMTADELLKIASESN